MGSGGAVATETGGTSDSLGATDGAEGLDADAGLDTAGDGDGDTSSGDGDGEPATGDGDGEPATGDGDGDGSGDGDGDASGDGDGDGGPLRVCGDGVVDIQEECDDGNLDGNDGCSPTCTLENVAPGVLMCGNKLYECGDGLDNDMDGKVDLEDPECTTPCDDDEGTFATNLPGQNLDCKTDCYFDANSGSGDDGCVWNLQCDPANPGAEIGCEFDPNTQSCEVGLSQSCIDSCTEPLVPNGCDCFGCCEIDGQFVYLGGGGDECSLANLDACGACTFNELCANPCEPGDCELCFGQTLEQLPPQCSGPSCPGDVTSCEDVSDCLAGEFCQTGCCVAYI